MNKKRIAKEWLYFVGGFLFGFLGFFVVPFIIHIIFGVKLGEFYRDFFWSFFFQREYGRGDILASWLVVWGPYILFQLVRSIVWAWRTVKTK